MSRVLEYDVQFLEAVVVREGGNLTSVPLEDSGERGGSRADTPPDGWRPRPGERSCGHAAADPRPRRPDGQRFPAN